jgi:hypothetical protein
MGFRRVGCGVVLAVCLAGIALFAAGCGGGSKVPSVASVSPTIATSSSAANNGSTGSGSTPSNAALAFVSCMRSHGLANFPDPLPNGGYSRDAMSTVHPQSPRFQSAERACSSLAVASGVEHTPAEIRQHVAQETAAESACMRKHGVPDMPDPNSQGTILVGSGVDSSSPQFRAAEKTCAYLNPGSG